MKVVTDYFIIVAPSYRELSQKVCEAIHAEWTPQGGVVTGHKGEYLQAVVKYSYNNVVRQPYCPR